MALNQLFRVGTEFRFEVGSAILGMKGLQNSVEGVSSAADNALVSFQRFGLAAVGNLGLGSGSVIGLLTKAVQSSEKFRDSQLKLSTILFANREKFIGPVDTFNQRMLVSEEILKRIAKEANKFSLPETELKDLTTLLGAQLAGKGLLGKNFENAIGLGRDFLKASPLLGVDPGLALGQLQDLVSGNAVKGRLFERLTAETTAFEPFQKGGTKAFNSLDATKRLQLLQRALKQFTSAQGEVLARTRTLTAVSQRFKNVLGGIEGILRPLGDVVLPPVVGIIHDLTNVMDKQLRIVFENLSKIVAPLAGDVRGLTINLLQLRRAVTDLKLASTGLLVVSILPLILKLGFLSRVFLPLARGIGRVLGFIAPLIFNMRVFGTIFRVAAFAVRTFLLPMVALFGVFQLISRAIAIAQVRDIEALPGILARFSGLAERASRAIANLTLPFRQVIDFVAEKIAFLFQRATILKLAFPLLETFVDFLDLIGKTVVLATAGLNGLFFALFQLVENLASGKILSAFDGVGDAFNAGINDTLEKNLKNLGVEQNPVVSQVTNINGGIKITNEFRENLEPDRIAFNLKEQLMKVAQNPSQARGRNFTRAGATAR